MSFDGWVSATLQELTTKIGSGATPRGGKKAYKSEGISLVRSLNVHDRWFKIKNLAFIDDAQAALLDNVILEEDDVLLNITGASIARCCVLPSRHLPARVNQHVSIVRTNQSAILPAFLCYLLTAKEYKDRLLSTGEKQGATRQALTKSLIQNFRVTFPQDLAEQKRIVSILDEAFSAIAKAKENAEKNLANARELFESYLNRVFTQQGPGWQEKPLGEACQFQNGYAFKSKWYADTGIRLLRNANVTHGHIDWSDDVVHLPPDQSKEFERFNLNERDVVLTLDRPIIKTGLKAAILTKADLPSLLLQRVLRITSEELLQEYIFHWLFSEHFRDEIDPGRSLGVPHISAKEVGSISIAFPSIEHQSQIVSQVEAFSVSQRRLETIYTQKLANLDELKQSLLQKAFTGQLTHESALQEVTA